ncbi:MAG: peptidase S41 [Candidatus Cloacimonetes bacterium]|nr:peptidase S41 [Candidatus Cloacimonadota bacterium]
MKKLVLFIILITSFSSLLFGDISFDQALIDTQTAKVRLDKEFDEGSNYELNNVNQQQTENLFKLCKIWGYVKYNHPEIAKGNINWDYELFRILPAINSEGFNIEVYNWIKSIGKLNKENKEKENLYDIKLHPNTEWINNENFLSKELSEELIKINNSIKDESNYYIDFVQNIGHPIFKNENPYPNMKWTDSGYKLLALFRYWNMIEYFFPYKHLIDEDWDNVLKNFIPKVIECQDELSYQLTMLELIGEIQDTHANIWQQEVLSQFYGKNIAPIEINFIENKAVVVRISEQLDGTLRIKIGDVITEISGVKTDELVEEKIKYCPASNYPTQLRDVAKRLLRTNEDFLQVTIENEDTNFQERISTVKVGEINFWEKELPSHKELAGDIGYIYPGTLKKEEVYKIMESFIHKKGLIIDLRCYPYDFIVFSFGKYLMPKPTEFAKFTNGSLENPGQFSFRETYKVGENNNDYFKGKVIILINETTWSLAEYTAMALRVAPKATVLGSTTAGADGNFSTIILPGNIRTGISGLGVYYPDGTETQRVGIIPDIELKPTIEGIRNGQDELLEKAIELINE